MSTTKKDTLETFDGAFNVQDMEQYVRKLGIIEWIGGSEEERTKERNITALQRYCYVVVVVVDRSGKL